MGTGPSTALR